MKMRRLSLVWLFAAYSLGACNPPEDSTAQPEPAAALLIFSKTSGFRHESIPEGIRAMQALGQEHNFRVDTTTNAGLFTTAGLQPYQAVVFLSTTQDVLNEAQQRAFELYIRSGRGFVGVHAATDTEYGWPWYGRLVGAYFNGHPAIQTATIQLVNSTHPATAGLPVRWTRTDEWYNFRDLSPNLTVLATLDESTYSGGTHGPNHPIAWYQEFEGGRAFYTAGGHTSESFREPLFRQHLLGGIRYAMGQQ
ncbi:ThuA domain-containing protein [Hymenobacter metallilatus]|uniref:ThuA domain-containing protein n=1 Tax=Hymenobacter metallilatus TaxID=2493666 RepID=A0A428JLS6_9BACT|nr:ThuA domain-containing protein [Hymenobacter metallilatus]RSK34010.1 ThuA domain-containing protein [Hymenobacter metallilatus]